MPSLLKFEIGRIARTVLPDDSYSLSTSPTDTTKPRLGEALPRCFIPQHPSGSPIDFATWWPFYRLVLPSIEDDVYGPTVKITCMYTLRRHLFGDPSDDLPAQLNEKLRPCNVIEVINA